MKRNRSPGAVKKMAIRKKMYYGYLTISSVLQSLGWPEDEATDVMEQLREMGRDIRFPEHGIELRMGDVLRDYKIKVALYENGIWDCVNGVPVGDGNGV